MELIFGENFRYPHPHVTFYLIDLTHVDDDPPALPDTAVLVTGLLSERGLDDGFIKFQGPSATSEFDAMYGDVSTKKYGLMGAFAKRHLQNGGAVIARRLTADDSALANALVSLDLDDTEMTSTFYVDERGEIFSEDAEGRDEVTIDTYGFNFNSESFADINEPGELDVTADGLFQNDLDAMDPVRIPLYGINTLGRGKWGNKFKMLFTETRQEFEGNTIFNYRLVDANKGEVFDDYDLTHVPEAVDQGVPVNLVDIVSRYSAKAGLTFYENYYEMFDVTMVSVFEDIISQLEAIQAEDGTDPTLTDGDLGPLISVLEDELAEANDPEEPYLDNIDLLGTTDLFSEATFTWEGVDENTGDPVEEEIALDLNLIFNSQGVDEIDLTNGHDGSLEDMRRFDWDFEDEAGDKIVEDMFEDFYSAITDPTINNLQEVDADGIMDVGYPLTVKRGISGLTNMDRQDMFYIMGIPEHIRNIDMLEDWTAGAFDPENQQMMKVGQTCEWRDDNGRIHRIPVSALLGNNLIEHFMNGYDEPFAGSNVYISGIQPGSLRPKMNTVQDRARMEEMNYNVVSDDNTGYFLDGQITNYKGGYSRLKEFFNIPIKGRIMKVALPWLESKKHILNTPENVEKVRADLQRNLRNQFGTKVSSIDVEAGFRNEQEEMRGDVTIRLYVAPRGSIKRFRLLTYIVPNI